jgi:hypothetical protein
MSAMTSPNIFLASIMRTNASITRTIPFERDFLWNLIPDNFGHQFLSGLFLTSYKFPSTSSLFPLCFPTTSAVRLLQFLLEFLQMPMTVVDDSGEIGPPRTSYLGLFFVYLSRECPKG